MKSTTFAELNENDVFAYGSKTFRKTVGVNGGISFNAEVCRKDKLEGDLWLFDNTDKVFFIKEMEIVPKPVLDSSNCG